jgi:hypothetical protein
MINKNKNITKIIIIIIINKKNLKKPTRKIFKDVEEPYLDSVPNYSFDNKRINEEINDMIIKGN